MKLDEKIRTIRLAGHSMHPVIQNGDALIVEKVPTLNIKRGDIICLLKRDHYIVHRVIGIRRGGRNLFLRMKGDNLEREDPVSCMDETCVYKVLFLLRKDRMLLKPSSHPFRAFLSSHNLTYGILKARTGRGFKKVKGHLTAWLRYGIFQLRISRLLKEEYNQKNQSIEGEK